MDYAAWKLFVDAAELGSLSKVALAYGTSQPHVSRRIGDLEQECGRCLDPARSTIKSEVSEEFLPSVNIATGLPGPIRSTSV